MKKVIEVVVYKVKEGVKVEQLEEARKKMDEILPEYSGFISLLRFSDLKEIGTVLDYVEWESLDSALKAAENFEKDPNMADLLSAIGSVVHMGHFYPEDNMTLAPEDFTAETVLEFAVAQVKEQSLETMREIKPELFEIVRAQKGLTKISSAGAVDSETVIFDALLWESEKDLASAMELVHKEEACQHFMKTFEKDIYFGQLKLS